MSIIAQIVSDPTFIGLISSSAGAFGFVKVIEWEERKRQRCYDKALEPVVIEGRTHQEWYDIIHSMGKDAVEDMALGPLDGLERAAEYGWDYKKLLGPLYQTLEKEWYPERYVVQAETLMPKNGDQEAAELKERAREAIENFNYQSSIRYNYNKYNVGISNTPRAQVYLPGQPKAVIPVKAGQLKSVSFRHPKMDPDVSYMRRGEELVQLVVFHSDNATRYKVFSADQISAYQRKHSDQNVTGIVDTYTLWRLQEEFEGNGGKINLPEPPKRPKASKPTAEELLEEKFAQQIRALEKMEDKHKEYQKYMNAMFDKW